MSELTFSAVDEIAPESADAPQDAPAIDTCIICGTSLVYAGSGAHPKYCADHKPRGGKAPKSQPGSASPKLSKNERLRKELTGTLALVGTGLMMVEPYDGLVILDRAEATADALMDVAEHNPRVRKALEQLLDVSVYGTLGLAVAGMVLPIAAHHGMLPLPEQAMERQFLSDDTQARVKRLREASALRTPNPEDDETISRFRATTAAM